MNKNILFLLACLCSFFSAESYCSLFMVNDVPFQMKAVVMGANGENLGEMVLSPQESKYFEDELGQSNPNPSHPGPPTTNSALSITPYTVYWYCMDGTSFSHCEGVAAGALVTPGTCPGSHYCKPPKPKEQTPSQ